jgi:hypothetical protein
LILVIRHLFIRHFDGLRCEKRLPGRPV